MKTMTLVILILAGLFSGVLPLRAEVDPSIKSVQRRDGQNLIQREGSAVIGTNAVELPEGILVLTNGTFTVNAGRERKLREGEVLSADGMLTSPDGTVAPVVAHVVMKKGRLHVVRDGEAVPAGTEVILGDGTRIKPDGTATAKDGQLRRLLDGQLAKLDGSNIPSTDTATLSKGRVVLQKDGGKMTLRPDQTIAMSDGTKVFGDGTVLFMDGSRTKLSEGVILKLPGVVPLKR